MKIIKVAMNVGYGCWISPDGEITDVEECEHVIFAEETAKNSYGLTWDDDLEDDAIQGPHESLGALMNHGWTHVRYNPLNIAYKGSLSPMAKKAIFRIINNDDEDAVYVSNEVSSTNGAVTKLDARRFVNSVT